MRQGTEMKHYTGILVIYPTISRGKRVYPKVFCETSDRPVEVSGLQGPCSACTGEQEGWGLFGVQTAKQRPFGA
jgi:hypothetical protein